MTDQEIFFDHWFISGGSTVRERFILNGKFEDFLKSHAEHFQSRGIFDDEDTNDSTG